VTDGDSRFDPAAGGKSWFFYPIERLGGNPAPQHLQGWMARRHPPRKILGKCRRLTSRPSSMKAARGRLIRRVWQIAQRSATAARFGTICAGIGHILEPALRRDDKQICSISATS
jgi:hypothetical protein